MPKKITTLRKPIQDGAHVLVTIENMNGGEKQTFRFKTSACVCFFVKNEGVQVENHGRNSHIQWLLSSAGDMAKFCLDELNNLEKT